MIGIKKIWFHKRRKRGLESRESSSHCSLSAVRWSCPLLPHSCGHYILPKCMASRASSAADSEDKLKTDFLSYLMSSPPRSSWLLWCCLLPLASLSIRSQLQLLGRSVWLQCGGSSEEPHFPLTLRSSAWAPLYGKGVAQSEEVCHQGWAHGRSNLSFSLPAYGQDAVPSQCSSIACVPPSSPAWRHTMAMD